MAHRWLMPQLHAEILLPMWWQLLLCPPLVALLVAPVLVLELVQRPLPLLLRLLTAQQAAFPRRHAST